MRVLGFVTFQSQSKLILNLFHALCVCVGGLGEEGVGVGGGLGGGGEGKGGYKKTKRSE